MRLVCVPGQNNKNFIAIQCKTVLDYKELELIRGVVTRSEYFPFLKGFNKSITESFLFNDTFVPATFLQELSLKALPALSQKVVIENTDLLFNKELNRDNFDDWVNSIILPDKFDIWCEEYDYQPESAYRALLFKNAKIEVSTGGGKTMITYLYCRYLFDEILKKDKYKGRNKILIVVPRTGLTKNTAKEIQEEYDYLNDVKLKIDTIYANSKRVEEADIIIGNYQSLCNYEADWFDQFSAIVVDELHSAKTYSIKTEIYDKCKNVEFVFGMTGTLPDESSLDYLQIVSMFGPTVLIKQTQELTKDGVIAPVKIQQIKINYNEDKNFSKNMVESGIVGADKYRVEKKYFQNNLERTNLIVQMIDSVEGLHVILVESRDYVKDLKTLFEKHYPDKNVFEIHGTINQNLRETIKDFIRENSNSILVCTYGTFSTGENIKNIIAVHFPDGGKSKIRMKQSVGRGVRLHPDKEFLTVFDYQDNMQKSSFKNHALDRNALYRKEGHKFLPPIEVTIS